MESFSKEISIVELDDNPDSVCIFRFRKKPLENIEKSTNLQEMFASSSIQFYLPLRDDEMNELVTYIAFIPFRKAFSETVIFLSALVFCTSRQHSYVKLPLAFSDAKSFRH